MDAQVLWALLMGLALLAVATLFGGWQFLAGALREMRSKVDDAR